MRIALVTDWFAPRKGGIESHLIHLAQELKQKGAQAEVITSYPGEASIEGIPTVRLRTTLLPIEPLAVSPLLRGTMRNALQTGGYDVVHLHPSIVAPVCLAGFLAARDLDLPILATYHSKLRMLPWLLTIGRKMTGPTQQPLKLTAVSNYIAEDVRRISPDRTVEILPNGYDASFWDKPIGKRPPHEIKKLKLVSSMRLEPRKRPMALLRTFRSAMIKSSGAKRRLELVIAGTGSEEARMQRFVTANGLNEYVKFIGWQSREALREIYRSSDAFVLASDKEAFCIAALEARAAGLPILAYHGTGLSEYIIDRKNGRLVQNDLELAAVIAELATDTLQLKTLSDCNTDLTRFDWKQLVEEHIAIYAALNLRSKTS